ncbi:Protein slowmo [Aphelenchoides fujianensis]|nr:Protein slowmo [Aphelenchoides fujianensis]
MKIWTSEHIFDHPWNTVVNAAYRKYPNPMNGAITGIDVVKQDIDRGVLKTERLTGFSGTQFSHEYTEIDPLKKSMTLTTRNLNGVNFLRGGRTPHVHARSFERVPQEASVVVNLPVFTDRCEKAFINVYQTNALKGRSGIDWVIDSIKREYTAFENKVTAEVHDFFKARS